MSHTNAYELPDLGYDYRALEPAYSAELLELHYSKHHKAYVDGANQALADLDAARGDRDFGKLNQLQKNLAFNVSGHVLHSIFWRNMSPEGAHTPSAELETEISNAFGDIDSLREHFLAAGTSIQGSGWAALAWEPLSGSLVVEQVYDHQDNLANGSVPLLVMDMWEHAFYLQYRNEKKRWAKAFWELVNWGDVSERLALVRNVEVPVETRLRAA